MPTRFLLALCCCLPLLVRAQVFIPAGAQNQVAGELLVADSLVNNGRLWLANSARFYFTGSLWAEGARQNTYGQGLVLFTGTRQQVVRGNLQLYRAVVNGAGLGGNNELLIDSALYLENGPLTVRALRMQNRSWIIRTGGSVAARPLGAYNLFYPQYQPLEGGFEALGLGLQNVRVDNIAGVSLREDLTAYGKISGPGTLIFNGGRQQNLRADAGFSLGQLFVQNAAGLSLLSSGSISNMLRFDAGKLFLNEQLLTLSSDAAIEGYNSDRYLVSGTNLGRLRRLDFSGTEIFPLGTASMYLPVTVTHAGPADFTLGLFSGITANALAGGPVAASKPFMVDMVWITESNATNNAQVRVQWQPQLEGSRFGALHEDQVGLWAFRGNWQLQNTAVRYNKAGNYAEATLPANGRLAIGTNDSIAAALQISLTARNALDANTISVQWLPNLPAVRSGAYTLEYSTDGISFSEQKQLPAMGLPVYRQLHRPPAADLHYYRVVYQSASGLKVYSNTAVVTNNAAGDFMDAFPNPTTGPVTLRFTTAIAGPAQLRLFDLMGRVVQSKELQLAAGVNYIRVDMGQLAAEKYIFQVRHEVVKVIKLQASE